MKFGDKVKWCSHHGTNCKLRNRYINKHERIGVIVEVVPANSEPKLYSDNSSPVADGRKHESYVVIVDNSPRKNRMYWPRVSGLERA